MPPPDLPHGGGTRLGPGEEPSPSSPGAARRWLGLAAGGAAVLGLSGGVRALIFRLTQKSMLVVGPRGERTPADVGIPFEAFEIASGRRRLAAWFVPAPSGTGPGRAVLVF